MTDTSHVPCKFFKVGQCQAGKACPFSHSTDASKFEMPCKYFSKVCEDEDESENLLNRQRAIVSLDKSVLWSTFCRTVGLSTNQPVWEMEI